MTLTPTDGSGSGVSATYYTLDGGAQQTYSAPLLVALEGSHTIVYWSLDAAGNAEAKNTGYVNIDLTAPATTATNLQADNHSGWQNASQVVSLAGSDALSGAATTYYTIDGGAQQTYASPFTVSAAGTRTIVYWSVDKAGNPETKNTGYVNIDLTAPTVSNDANAAWHNSAVTVTLTPADSGGSGVAATQYRLQGSSTWLAAAGNAFVVPAPADGSGDGAQHYQYQALDGAGNASATGACTVKIDTQGPVVTPTGLQADDLSGWTGTTQTISLVASDAGAGAAATYYTVDGGAQKTYTSPFTVSGSGQHPVVYWATDVLGNVTAQHTGWVNISNPFAQATNLAPDNHSGWRNSATTVTITGSGDQPPIKIFSKLDAGAWQNVTSPASVPVSGQGSHTVAFYAVNNVGVQSVQETGYVNIDLTVPATSATGLQADNHSGWQTTSQPVTLTASDTLSGVATSWYTVDGGAAQAYSGAAFAVSGSGSHTITYWSVDAAGNTEPAHTGYVNIDTTAPATTAAGLQADDDSGWTTNPAPTVTLSASDVSGSGVSATYYTLDGSDQTTYAGAFTVSGDGQHQVTYWSVDAMGNTEAANTGYVNIDTTAPTTIANGLVADGASGWLNAAQTVTLAGDDGPGCGVTTTSYTIDGGAVQTYSDPFTVSSEGSHAIVYWSVDAVGNAETANTGYVNIDLTAPTVGSDADGAWHNGAVTVHLSPADTGGSTLSGTQYRVQGTQAWSAAAGNAFVVPAPADHSGDGAWTYEYRALDAAGNASTTGTCTVKIDTRPPATAATGLQADNHSGWRNAPQSVTLASDDGTGSGATATYYTLDGGARQTYATAFAVSTPGTHTIVYWSVDGAGNTEGSHSGYVNVDLAAPTVGSDADTAWHNSAVTVRLSPADSGGSGVAATQYRPQGSSTWLAAAGNAFVVPAPADHSGDGSWTYDYQALDAAGNASTTGTCTVKIDTRAPATTTTDLQPDKSSGWQTTSQLVHLTPGDAGSGVAATYYTLDGGARQTYSTAFTVSGAGRHRVMYWSTDNLGNIESPHVGYVNIDTTAPVTLATGLAADQSTWENTPQVVSLDADDSLSGLAATYYTLDGGGAQTYSGPLTISADGRHTLTYWSVDAIGNTETTKSGYVSIDTAAPTTTATGLAADQNSGWQTSNQVVSLAADDGTGSGSAGITYTLDGGGAQTYSSPFTVSGTGQHRVTFFATDLAGNSDQVHTGWVNISNPFAQAADLAVDGSSGWQNAPVNVNIGAAGDQPPFTIFYQIDGGSLQTAASPAGFTVSAEGSHRIVYYARNSVGAESVHETGYVNIDLTAPATTADDLQADGQSGWVTTPQTVSLHATDNLAGVSATYYTLDAGSRQTYAGTPIQVSGDGSHAVTYWSVDAAGNPEGSHTGYVNIDATPPTVGDDADASWHNTPVTVVLSPDDAGGSGVAATQYRLQGSSTWLAAAGNAFVVPAPPDGSGDGARVYEFRALDNAGNPSGTDSCTVRIDTQAPAVTTDADAYWHNSAVIVHLQATDTASGADQISYRPQGATAWTIAAGGAADVPVAVPTDGQPHSFTYEYQSSDGVGNTTAVATFTVNIDTRMPNTALSGLPAALWVNKPVSLTFRATPGDGAAIVRTEYSLDGGASWTPIAAGTPLVIATPGQTAVLYRSVNAAGTVENPARAATVSIDTGRPTCLALKKVTARMKKVAKLQFRISDPVPSCGFAKVTITICLKKKVVKRITIARAKTNATVTYKYKVKLKKKGTYTWKVSATDIAGNKALKIGSKTLTVK